MPFDLWLAFALTFARAAHAVAGAMTATLRRAI